MAGAKKTAVGFEEIIQADRERRKNEALAQEIFGRGRRPNGPGTAQGARKPGTGPSLASRVGIVKRSASASSQTSASNKNQVRAFVKPPGNVNAEWTHDLHESSSTASARGGLTNNRVSRGGRMDREARLDKAINGSVSTPALNSQFNVVSKTKSSSGISIRGLAGPSVVIAENFAPGTTAADIESAMSPVGGPILSCSVVTSASTVIAELVFESREGADNVIAQFHDQTADGRVLSLFHKPGPLPATVVPARPEPAAIAPPLGPRADIGTDRANNNRSSTRYGGSGRYEPREQSRDRRRGYERDDVVDGTYGFESMDMDEPETGRDSNASRGLYSDNIVNRKGGRGDDKEVWQDNRGDYRRNDRGHDRSRGYR